MPQLKTITFFRVFFLLSMLLMTLTLGNLAWAQDFFISKPENSRTINICQDILLPAYRALGIEPVLLEFPGRRALYVANSGKTDAELCRIKDIAKQYPNLVKVEPALLELTIVALSIKPLPQVATRADLKGFTLGSQRGMKAAENYFQDHEIHYVNSYQQVIQLLDDGLIDYAILTVESINRYQQADHRDDFFIHQPPLFQHKLYHFVHKRHQHLVSALAFEISRVISTKTK